MTHLHNIFEKISPTFWRFSRTLLGGVHYGGNTVERRSAKVVKAFEYYVEDIKRFKYPLNGTLPLPKATLPTEQTASKNSSGRVRQSLKTERSCRLAGRIANWRMITSKSTAHRTSITCYIPPRAGVGNPSLRGGALLSARKKYNMCRGVLPLRLLPAAGARRRPPSPRARRRKRRAPTAVARTGMCRL